MFDDFRLKDSQILANLLDVCSKENVEYTEDGLEAVIFTAQVIKTTFRWSEWLKSLVWEGGSV
jgi:hypothetical protein